MNNGCYIWLIILHAPSNLPTEACSARGSTFQASCMLSSFYSSVFLLFWLPITRVCRVLYLTIANSAKCLCTVHIRSPCTSLDYTMILGVPILPVPTLIELMSSLRSNYALYSDTMPLTTQVVHVLRHTHTHTHTHDLLQLHVITTFLWLL